MLRGLAVGLCLAALLSAQALAGPKVPAPPAEGVGVADFAGVLSPSVRDRIRQAGERLRQASRAQISVATVDSLEGAAIEDYSLALLRAWRLGGKKLNNGALILIAVKDRKCRIEIGYGLEGAIPDAKAGRILDQTMLPWLARGDYDAAALQGFAALARAVAKEYRLDPETYAP